MTLLMLSSLGVDGKYVKNKLFKKIERNLLKNVFKTNLNFLQAMNNEHTSCILVRISRNDYKQILK